MQFLRLRRTPKLAVPKHETDIFFVDENGVFKKMGPDGSVAEVGSGGGGGSMPFQPTDLDGLALWLDASDAATINDGSPADDDPVSAWADKSGNGFDAIPVPQVQTVDVSAATSGNYTMLDPLDGVTESDLIDWTATAAEFKAAISSLPAYAGLLIDVQIDAHVYTVSVTDPTDSLTTNPMSSNWSGTIDAGGTITLVQEAVASPAYKAAVWNGEGVVRYATDVNMVLRLVDAALGMFNDVGGVTVVAVLRLAADEPSSFFVAKQSDANPTLNRLHCHYNNNAFGFEAQNDDSLNAFDDAGIVATSQISALPLDPDRGIAVLWGAVSLLGGMTASGSSDLYGSGPANVGTNQFAVPLAAFPALDSAAIFLSDAVPGGSGAMIGDYCELLVFTRALNTQERRQLLEFLSAKWATL